MSFLTRLLEPDYMKQPPAYFHPRILVGAGAMLTVRFAKHRSITHVINCAFDEDSPAWWRQHVPEKYVVLNAVDLRTGVNIIDWYPKFEEAMLRFLRDGDGVVFVHCQAGMNRSASLAMAYCCDHFRMEYDALYMSTKRQRPCILMNPVFTNQVKEFINGRLQSEKGAGEQRDSERNGDFRLIASGDSSESEGVQDDAGDTEGGMRLAEVGDRIPSPEERDNGCSEGEPVAVESA